jgi:hypothetical protein
MLMAGGYNKNVIRTVVQKQNLDKKMDSQRVNSVQQETNYLLYTHFDVFLVNKTILVKKFFWVFIQVVKTRKNFFTRITYYSKYNEHSEV